MTNSDIDRDVYCVLGLVIDAVDMEAAAGKMRSAGDRSMPYLLSTPNVNFLINCGRDHEFHEAVLASDLCVVDGMPLIWIARMLGVPLPERVAGSDLFERLKHNDSENCKPMPVFFFGGEEGVGKKACKALNSQNGHLRCVGALDPGFVPLDEMSSDEIISEINNSGATFLVVALGAVKGHIWLERNKDKLDIPLRSHLGAVINFEAGGVARSPGIIGRLGFEWLWRIKEEPKLWRRYWSDGLDLMAIMLTRVLPMVCWSLTSRFLTRNRKRKFALTSEIESGCIMISISGYAGCENLDEIRTCFKSAVDCGLDIILNFKDLEYLSASVLGTLMMLKKQLKHKKMSLKITGVTPAIRRLFKWQGLEFLAADCTKKNNTPV